MLREFRGENPVMPPEEFPVGFVTVRFIDYGKYAGARNQQDTCR
jgi:hypothetical protein